MLIRWTLSIGRTFSNSSGMLAHTLAHRGSQSRRERSAAPRTEGARRVGLFAREKLATSACWLAWLASLPFMSGCSGIPRPAPAAASPASAAGANGTTIVAIAPPKSPPPTIWQFLGVDKALHFGLYSVDQVRNRLGRRFPGLEHKPAVLALSDPANLESSNPAVKGAASAKAEEDAAPQKMKALSYLATLGCGCYPGTKDSLLAGLDDCTEKVRFAAVSALRDAAGSSCSVCQSSSCCDEEVVERLDKVAYERTETGCFKEPSARVRRVARQALRVCACRPVAGEAVERPLEGGVPSAPGELPPPKPEAKKPAASTAQALDASKLAMAAQASNDQETPYGDQEARTETPEVTQPVANRPTATRPEATVASQAPAASAEPDRSPTDEKVVQASAESTARGAVRIPTQVADDPPSAVRVVVNGEAITKSELRQACGERLASWGGVRFTVMSDPSSALADRAGGTQGADGADSASPAEARELERLIDRKLVMLDAKRRLPVLEFAQRQTELRGEFDRMVEQMMREQGIASREQLSRMLASDETSWTGERDAFVEEMLATEWLAHNCDVAQQVSHEDQLAWYRSHRQDFTTSDAVRWEVLKVESRPDRSPRECRQLLAELGNQVAAQGSMQQVLRSHERGSEASWTTMNWSLRSEVPDGLRQALFELPRGALSPILETDVGPCIVRVLGRRRAQVRPFEEVQPRVAELVARERRLRNQQGYLSRLRREARVEPGPKSGSSSREADTRAGTPAG